MRYLPWLAAVIGGGIGAIGATALGTPVAIIFLAQTLMAAGFYQLTKRRLGLNT